MKNAYFIILIFFLACKKEKKQEINIPPASERFKILTQNRWLMTHEYVDSTTYAKTHLDEWPLSTTDDFMDMYDTCTLETENIFLPTGNWKLNKSSVCSSGISDDVGHWRLINNDNDFVIVGQDTLHIVELNNSRLKMYYESYTYYQQQLIRIKYIMWTFRAR